MADPWALLGVEPGTSLREAKAAWLRRLQLLHPDKHPGADPRLLEEANRAVAQLNDAWHEIQRIHRESSAAGQDASRSRSSSEPPGRGSRERTRPGSARQRWDLAEEVGFLLDALEQGAQLEKVRFSPAELRGLERPFSTMVSGSLVQRAERALLAAMILDARSEAVLIVDPQLSLPESWVETYELLSALDDPPIVFALTEAAGRCLFEASG